MNWNLPIDQQLDALGGGTCDCRLDLSHGQTLELKGAMIERLACSFEQLTLHCPGLDKADSARLKGIAQSLSERLSYLLEAIRPIEIDDEACVVQMRSVPPSKHDDATTYYELVVSRGQIGLCRFSKTPGQCRCRVPASLTREAFRRLAHDLSEAAL